MTDEIKAQWEILRKKYTLPEFSSIDSEFSIDKIETNFPLRAVIEKVMEKIDFYSGMLSDLVQPDPANIYSMHETRFFDDNEKKSVYSLYVKLMAYNRKCVELFLANNESEYAGFIILFFKEWQDIKKQLLPVISKMRESWHDESEIKEDLGYLG